MASDYPLTKAVLKYVSSGEAVFSSGDLNACRDQRAAVAVADARFDAVFFASRRSSATWRQPGNPCYGTSLTAPTEKACWSVSWQLAPATQSAARLLGVYSQERVRRKIKTQILGNPTQKPRVKKTTIFRAHIQKPISSLPDHFGIGVKMTSKNIFFYPWFLG